MKPTVVLNLFGGPGTGKSTTAAAVFAQLKRDGVNAELVREYVKGWAWEGRKIGPLDQFYFFGKQGRAEAQLFGKVDVIVTDSPVVLGAFYASKYAPAPVYRGVLEATRAWYEQAAAMGVRHVNVQLQRAKAYNPAGRYETVEQAREIDGQLNNFLTRVVGWRLSEYGTDEVSTHGLARAVEEVAHV